MRLISKFLLSIVVFLALSASGSATTPSVATQSAQTTAVYKDPATNVLHYIVIYPQEDLWRVDHFAEAPGELQEHIGRKTFPDSKQARAYAESLAKTLGRPYVPGPRSNPPVRKRLAGPALWAVTSEWSLDWERKYSQWVESSVSRSFFSDHQIATDCADVAVSVRWIFARINGLPAADVLAGSGTLFTQETVKPEWEALPTSQDWTQDQRFLAALNYLIDNVYTHSVLEDSYPIAIKPETLTAGSHHLELFGATGHTLLVTRVDPEKHPEQPIQVIFSTVPKIVRVLGEDGYWNITAPKKGLGGFLRFRWPVRGASGSWELKAATEMPGYSEEEFDPSFMGTHTTFWEAVLFRLKPDLDYSLLLKQGVESLKSLILGRADIVNQGIAVCGQTDCAPGTENYENWSTPSRDRRIAALFTSLRYIAYGVGGYEGAYGSLWESLLKSPTLKVGEIQLTLQGLELLWDSGAPDSDPRSPLLARWGTDPTRFGLVLSSSISDALKSRVDLIRAQGTACAQSTGCEPDSTEWLKWTTAEPVEVLRGAQRHLDGFCRLFPETLCHETQNGLAAQTLSAGARTYSVAEWLDLAFWLSSDPRAPLAHRWGEQRRQYRGGPVLADIQSISEDGLMFLAPIAGRNQGEVIDLDHDRTITTPTLVGPVQAEAKSGGLMWLDWQSPTGTTVIRFWSPRLDRSQSFTWLGLIGASDFQWVDPDHASFIDSQRSIHVLDIAGLKQPIEVGVFPILGKRLTATLPSGILLLDVNPGSIRLIDLRAKSAQIRVYSGELPPDADSITLRAFQLGSNLWGMACNSKSYVCSVIGLDSTRQSILPLMDTPAVYANLLEGMAFTAGIENLGKMAVFVTLNADLSVRSKLTFPDSFSLTSPDGKLAWIFSGEPGTPNQKDTLFHLQAGAEPEQLKPLPDEAYVLLPADGDWITWSTQDGHARLRNATSSEPVPPSKAKFGQNEDFGFYATNLSFPWRALSDLREPGIWSTVDWKDPSGLGWSASAAVTNLPHGVVKFSWPSGAQYWLMKSPSKPERELPNF